MTWDWHHLDFAHASSILHIATEFGQSQGSHAWGLHVLHEPASVVHRIPMVFMLKSVHWPIGQDSGLKVQKSALTSGTTAQLAVLAECALEQMHIHDWVEGSINGWLPFLTTARKVSINYYAITHLHIQLCILYTLISYYYHYIVFEILCCSISLFHLTQYYLLSLIIFAIHVYNSPEVLYLYLFNIKKRFWWTGFNYLQHWPTSA